MKKKNLLMAAIVSCMAIQGAWAQESIKINETSTKGFYVKIGGGYAFGTGKTSGSANDLMPAYNTNTVNNSEYQSRFGTVNTDIKSNTTTKTDAKFSLGEGVNMGLGIGYMFNRYIGAELNADYLLGISNTVETKNSTRSYRDVAVSSGYNKSTHTVTETSNSNATTNSMKRSGFSLTPAIKLMAPVSDRFSIYSRVGIVIPLSDKMVYESENHSSSFYSNKVNNSRTSTYSNGSENKKMEFSSYFKLGYTAALGVNFSLGKHFDVFGEINTVSTSFEAKKSTITEWTEFSSNSNGTTTNKNKLNGLKPHDIETEYLKDYVVDNTNPKINQDSPRKDVSFSLPASSMGINVGIAFKF